MKSGLDRRGHGMAMAALLAASTASGALLVHDNFDYAPGTTIAAGGTLGSAADGFSNAWKFDGYSGEVVPGLEFPGVESSGNALKLTRNDSGFLFRGMSSSLTAGTYYLGMLFYRNDSNGGGGEDWSLQLKNSSSYGSGPGSSTKTTFGSTSGEQASIRVAGGNTGTGTASYNVGSTVFMLARLVISDSGSETASMKWYNTGDSVSASDSEIVWDATSTGEFSGGAGWRFNLPKYIDAMTIDEFKLGTEITDVIPASDQDLPPTHPSFRHVFIFTDHYKIHSGESSSKSLSVDHCADDEPVKLLEANNLLSQRWIVDPLGDGRIRMRTFNAPYYVRANAEEGGWNNGDPVQLHSWMDWGSQKWTVIPQDNGEVAFQMDDPGFYLSAKAFTNDAPIEIDSWQDEPRQKWMMDLQETIQSPYILRGTDGDLLAFFRYSTPVADNKGLLYASQDDGQTWSLRTIFEDIYGPTLFVLNNALYMLHAEGPDLLLKKSIDHGLSWSDHVLATLSDDIECGGSAVLVKDGILYYGFTDHGAGGPWPEWFRLRVASCSVSNDLTSSASWTITAPLAFPSSPAIAGTKNGWLEPSCVEGPDGRIWVVARVDKTSTGDVAAVLKVSGDRTTLEFTNQYPAPGNETGFIHAPWAGSSKFHFVYDAVSGRYLVMSNPYLGAPSSNSRHAYVRNILALYETVDLKNYQLVKTLIDDDSFEDWSQSSWFTGFQYPAFIIDGSSLKYVARTAYKSFDNYHDANMGTYHELENFREKLSPDGEMAYYRFDRQNDPGFDSSKMGGNYADVSGAAFVAEGRYGGCLSFDGIDDGLGLMNRVSPKLHRSTQVSVSVWIKNNTDSGPVFTSAIDGAHAGLGLQVLFGKLRMSARSVSSDALQTREFDYSSTGEWHHVVAQWDFKNNTMRLWLDNVEQAGTGTVAFGSREYIRGAPKYQDSIGRHFNGSSFFDGCIDEFHIYARALDAGEIAALFNGPGYGEWSSNYALTGGAGDDDDSDGLPNLYEYGVGGNPTNPADQGIAPEYDIAEAGGTNWLDYVYPIRLDSSHDLLYHLELSSDLVAGSWVNAGYVVVGTNITGNSFNYVSNRVSTVDDARFIRLVIKQR